MSEDGAQDLLRVLRQGPALACLSCGGLGLVHQGLRLVAISTPGLHRVDAERHCEWRSLCSLCSVAEPALPRSSSRKWRWIASAAWSVFPVPLRVEPVQDELVAALRAASVQELALGAQLGHRLRNLRVMTSPRSRCCRLGHGGGARRLRRQVAGDVLHCAHGRPLDLVMGRARQPRPRACAPPATRISARILRLLDLPVQPLAVEPEQRDQVSLVVHDPQFAPVTASAARKSSAPSGRGEGASRGAAARSGRCSVRAADRLPHLRWSCQT